jgi:hypothetical protein
MMVSRSFKSCSLPCTIINFLIASLTLLANFENALFKAPFSVIGRCSLVPTSHLQGKCARINYDFTESQAAFCKHFQCENRRIRVFEAGYRKDFQNQKVISKEQAKTLSLILSST